MSPSSLQAIKRLADQGATIIGQRPKLSTGLITDTLAFNRMVNSLWSGNHPNIIDTNNVQQAIDSLTRGPDFSCTHIDSIRYVHRRTDSAEIYWVNNRSNSTINDWFQFRVTGRKPQLWNAVTGQISDVSYMVGTHSTYVNVQLQPADAVFIVFSGPCDKSLRHSEKQKLPIRTHKIEKPWRVEFARQMGTPEYIMMNTLKIYTDSTLAIPDSTEARTVKYFSGTASYRNSFNLNAIDTTLSYCLDLGRVYNIAEVWINGKFCGQSWFPPHFIDISSAVKQGVNTLEIKVTNPWKNRICGDKLAKEYEKSTPGHHIRGARKPRTY